MVPLKLLSVILIKGAYIIATSDWTAIPPNTHGKLERNKASPRAEASLLEK